MLDTATRSLVSLGDANPHVLRLASAQLSPVMDAARYRRSAGGVRVYAQMGRDVAYAPGFFGDGRALMRCRTGTSSQGIARS